VAVGEQLVREISLAILAVVAAAQVVVAEHRDQAAQVDKAKTMSGLSATVSTLAHQELQILMEHRTLDQAEVEH
jgi:hypothetical protein